MAVNPTIPIILCGGKGTRLWPLSRESFPKQYLSFDSLNQKTLLQKTQERLIGINNIKYRLTLKNRAHNVSAESNEAINRKVISSEAKCETSSNMVLPALAPTWSIDRAIGWLPMGEQHNFSDRNGKFKLTSKISTLI